MRVSTNASLRTCDVAIVGCGLSGLVAGLLLQRQGHEVIILERRASYGGLCGTFEMDGYEFVIACNDFGQGMVRTLEELEVPVRFEHKKTRIHSQDKVYELPLGLGAARRLVREAPDLLRFLLGLRRALRTGEGPHDLGSFVDGAVHGARARDLLKLPAYLMGVCPEDLPLSALRDEVRFEYGYSKPATPVGGPQVLADALAARFLERGKILLSTECLGVHRQGEQQLVETSAGPLLARAVLSTAGWQQPVPEGCKPGLPMSMLCLVVSKELTWPRAVHTLVHLPPGVSEWSGRLDEGQAVLESGFHLFRSELPERPGHYTFNACFYLPRGVEEPSEALARYVREYILSRAERMLPGLRSALVYERLLSPRAFRERHGLSSRVMPLILPPGVERAPNHDERSDLYHAGGGASPPGDHAGAAILSARYAAELINKRLSHQPKGNIHADFRQHSADHGG